MDENNHFNAFFFCGLELRKADDLENERFYQVTFLQEAHNSLDQICPKSQVRFNFNVVPVA